MLFGVVVRAISWCETPDLCPMPVNPHRKRRKPSDFQRHPPRWVWPITKGGHYNGSRGNKVSVDNVYEQISLLILKDLG